MLQYDRIDVSEGITLILTLITLIKHYTNNINKTSKSKECVLCHYWYFKNVGYKTQPHLCNGCHAVSMMAFEFKILQY